MLSSTMIDPPNKRDKHKPRYSKFLLCYAGAHPKYTFLSTFWVDSTPLSEVCILDESFNQFYEKQWTVLLTLNTRRCKPISKKRLVFFIQKHNSMHSGDANELHLENTKEPWSSFEPPIIAKKIGCMEGDVFKRILAQLNNSPNKKKKSESDEMIVYLRTSHKISDYDYVQPRRELKQTSPRSKLPEKELALTRTKTWELVASSSCCTSLLALSPQDLIAYFFSEFLFTRLSLSYILVLRDATLKILFKSENRPTLHTIQNTFHKYAFWTGKHIDEMGVCLSTTTPSRPNQQLFAASPESFVMTPSLGIMSTLSFSQPNIFALLLLLRDEARALFSPTNGTLFLNHFHAKNIVHFGCHDNDADGEEEQRGGLWIQFDKTGGKRVSMALVLKKAALHHQAFNKNLVAKLYTPCDSAYAQLWTTHVQPKTRNLEESLKYSTTGAN